MQHSGPVKDIGAMMAIMAVTTTTTTKTIARRTSSPRNIHQRTNPTPKLRQWQQKRRRRRRLTHRNTQRHAPRSTLPPPPRSNSHRRIRLPSSPGLRFGVSALQPIDDPVRSSGGDGAGASGARARFERRRRRRHFETTEAPPDDGRSRGQCSRRASVIGRFAQNRRRFPQRTGHRARPRDVRLPHASSAVVASVAQILVLPDAAVRVVEGTRIAERTGHRTSIARTVRTPLQGTRPIRIRPRQRRRP
mmetsp:Transcript_3111/g.6275  ORF Transcript_3111/g.6275 Transcript_3111/m.6275 type:complete len:248 (+) Transcript_3111:824-1567(+)